MAKFIITGPRGQAFRIVVDKPTSDAVKYVEATDEQAAIIQTQLTAKQSPVYTGGSWTTREDIAAAGDVLNWDETTQMLVRSKRRGQYTMAYDISKLAIVERIEALGVLPHFMALIAADPAVQFKWDAAQVIRSDHPLFTSYAPQLKNALNLTDEQFAGVIRR